jgi:hypothetical protein
MEKFRWVQVVVFEGLMLSIENLLNVTGVASWCGSLSCCLRFGAMSVVVTSKSKSEGSDLAD